MEGSAAHPSPYVWIRSQKLRKPHCPPRPLSSDSHHSRRAGVYPSDASAPAHQHQLSRPNSRRTVGAMGDSGQRRVKTAASDQLFQTGIEPAYIDHKGDLINGSPEYSRGNNSVCSASGQRRERPKSSRTGWGVMLPPPQLEESDDSGAQKLSQRLENLEVQTSANSCATNTAPAAPHTVGVSSNAGGGENLQEKQQQQQQRSQIGLEEKPSPSATDRVTDHTKPSRPRSAVEAAVDRAWPESASASALKRDSRDCTTPGCSWGQTARHSSSTLKTGKGRRVTSAAPNTRSPQTPEDLPRPATHGVTAATGHTRSQSGSAPGEDKDPHRIHLINTEKDVAKIRPITAGTALGLAKHYCEERLQAIYARRRSRSAIPGTTRSEQLSSGMSHHCPETPETPESRERVTQQGRTTHAQQSVNDIASELQIHTSEDQAAPKLATDGVQSGLSTPVARFRLVVWITVCLRRLFDEIIRLSGEKTLRSATELQWMAIYAEKHDASLAFNKHLFSRDRVMAHVPYWAQCILLIPPVERTESHCRKLHALLRGLRSFDKFTDEIQMALCKAFTMERVEEGRIVLKNGHVGLNFYFIYSGSVFVNQEDVTRQGRVFSRTVATLSRGDSFGELALLQDIRRTATVSVREGCELLVVDKDVFASVCPRIFDKELAEKHAFIKTLDLFSPSYWSLEAIHALSMNSQIQEYKINKIIVADSTLEDWIYICMLGKCQIVRCLSIGGTAPEGEMPRKESDVVLSEEILQLLASAGQTTSGEPLDRGDSKENLLSSLQLDYVQTSKKLYVNEGKDKDVQRRALLGLSDTSTLTAYIQRQRDLGKTNLVYLNVGVLEAGQIFDLPSLLEEDSTANLSGGSSTLMLVSSGARMIRIKKVAFQDQASHQALDNTRTLASKQVTPTEQSILESYKEKIAWEDFKASLVRDVKRQKMMRYQPLHRSSLKTSQHPARERQAKSPHHPSGRRKSARIITVLENIHKEGEEIRRESIARRSKTGRWAKGRPPPSVVFHRRRRSLTLEDMRSGNTKDFAIIRRQSAGVDANKRICKKESEPPPMQRQPSANNIGFLQQTLKMST